MTERSETGANRRLRLIGAVVVVSAVLVGGYLVADAYFFPEAATQVDEGDDAASDARAIKAGTFSGKAGHDVSGTVTLYRDDEGYYLRFEDYEQTQGPDVYVYLTPAADPDTTAEIRAGRKVLVDGGADGGESTKEGTFVQRLPPDIDPDAYGGVAIWCERFSVPFGAAPLEATN